MAEYYRFARASGVEKVHYAEAYPNWGEGPKLAISLKLQWNPDQDVDQLLREWYDRAVGPARGAGARRLLRALGEFWTEGRAEVALVLARRAISELHLAALSGGRHGV